jgi:hypothetical protein
MLAKYVEVGLYELTDGRLLHADGWQGHMDFIDEPAK